MRIQGSVHGFPWLPLRLFLLALFLGQHHSAFCDHVAGITTIGTTAYPQGGMIDLGGADELFTERYLKSVVIDPGRGYLYVGAAYGAGPYGPPGRIVKIALGAEAEPPVRIGAATLNLDEYLPYCAVIDVAHGYAYFGTLTSPGNVVKVALGEGDAPPRRVGSIRLEPGEDRITSAVIDLVSGYAYFGASPSGDLPGRVIKVALGDGDSPPLRIGAVALEGDEVNLSTAVIDTNAGYAYFGTDRNDPGKVVKVALGPGSEPPGRVGAVPIGPPNIKTAVIDPEKGFAYFVSRAHPSSSFVKVALGTGDAAPVVSQTLILTSVFDVRDAVIDATRGFVYLGSKDSILKINIATEDGIPISPGSTRLSEGILLGGAIDAARGYAYFGTEDNPGKVVKVALGQGSEPPSTAGVVTLQKGEDNILCGVIDPASKTAYFGTGVSQQEGMPQVVKMSLGAGQAKPFPVGVLDVPIAQSLTSADIHTAHHFACFADSRNLFRIRLGESGNPPFLAGIGGIRSSAISDPTYFRNLMIDPATGYAYVGGSIAASMYSPSHGVIAKVAVSDFEVPPDQVSHTEINALTPDAGLHVSLLDSQSGFAYYGTTTAPGRVVKVRLETGNAPPIKLASVLLDAGEDILTSGVIDLRRRYAYFGTSTLPGRIIKVALGVGSTPPRRVGALTLDPEEGYLSGAIIDVDRNVAWFATYSGHLIKVALGEGNALPTQSGKLALDSHIFAVSVALTDSAGYAYVATGTYPAIVEKVSIAQKDVMRATKFALAERGFVRSFSFYAHKRAGNVRLAIYGNEIPRNLLWQSESVPVSVQDDWITVAMQSGNPASLNLPAGVYWLAWQVDSLEDVGSYQPGYADIGFRIPHPFGSAPQLLNEPDIVYSDQAWSAYINYDSVDDMTSLMRNGLLGGTPAAPDLNGDAQADIADLLAILIP